MAITKQKKVAILKKLAEEVVPAETVVFASFQNLPVQEVTNLRRELSQAGTGYYVAKKTLIRKAFAGQPPAGEMPELVGEVAVAYLASSGDLLAPAKGLYTFQKKHPEMIKIIGGVFEGKFIGASEMVAIAAIPAREVLYGQLVNIINSPIQGLVVVLDAIAKSAQGRSA